MVLHLDFSPEIEARLRERAAALGKDINQFVVETIQERLGNGLSASLPTFPSAKPQESAAAWIARFDAWVESHPRRGYVADDGRDSIYAGRGE